MNFLKKRYLRALLGIFFLVGGESEEDRLKRNRENGLELKVSIIDCYPQNGTIYCKPSKKGVFDFF